jgi:hypothetical protein
MSREEIHKLLGGYATGTLTPEEREALFAAALEDQELFDALAKEQPLHDLLREPGARAQLLAALDERPQPWYRAWWRPAAAVVAMAGIAVVAVLVFRGARVPPLEVAQVKDVVPAPSPVASDKPAAPPVQPKLKVFHAPPPAAPARQKVEVAPPPEVVSPTLAPQPAPQAALGLGQQGGVVGGVVGGVPAAAPSAQAMFYKRQEGAKDAVAESKPAEARAMARVAGNAMTMRAAAESVPRLGVRYTILRKQPDGEFAAADPDDLKKGDVVELSLQPNESGYLTVTAVSGSRAHVVASGFVLQMAKFTTPVLKPDDTELRVTFSRRQQTVVGALVDSAVESSSDAGQRSTYVVGPNNGQFVNFPITLNYR